MSNSESVEQAAYLILETLISTPFEQCLPVGRAFPTLTTRHSLYAIRHRVEGLPEILHQPLHCDCVPPVNGIPG
jgi:hypothetical protein